MTKDEFLAKCDRLRTRFYGKIWFPYQTINSLDILIDGRKIIEELKSGHFTMARMLDAQDMTKIIGLEPDEFEDVIDDSHGEYWIAEDSDDIDPELIAVIFKGE